MQECKWRWREKRLQKRLQKRHEALFFSSSFLLFPSISFSVPLTLTSSSFPPCMMCLSLPAVFLLILELFYPLVILECKGEKWRGSCCWFWFLSSRFCSEGEWRRRKVLFLSLLSFRPLLSLSLTFSCTLMPFTLCVVSCSTGSITLCHSDVFSLLPTWISIHFFWFWGSSSSCLYLSSWFSCHSGFITISFHVKTISPVKSLSWVSYCFT